MTNQILPISGKYEAKNYPYGRLRTSAFFSIEFKHGKGFRDIFQTINPKNQRINAPKKSTYCNALSYIVLNEDGHYKVNGMTVHGNEDVNKVCRFIIENASQLQLTPDMYKHLGGLFITAFKVGYSWSMKLRTEEATEEQIRAIYKPVIDAACIMYKSGDFLLDKCIIDVDTLNTLERQGNDRYR